MKSKGFTLVEMIIAVALSFLILIAIIEVSTSMIRQQFETIAKGELSGQTLISLDQMNKDLENANVLLAPSQGTPNSDAVLGCINWSMLYNLPGGQILDASQPVEGFYYCAQPTGTNTDSGAAIYTFWRYTETSCSAAVPAACGSSAGGWSGPEAVVYNSASSLNFNGLYKESGYASFFYWTNQGLMTHYIVGNPTANKRVPIARYYQVDNVITMQKNYSDTND